MKRLAALVLAFLPLLALAQGFDPAHREWDALLKKHVVLGAGGKASQVRYAAFAKDRAALKSYLDALSGVPGATFDAWPKAERIAFLINAYNAFTVELILANYPVKSIKDIGGILDNRWKRRFFTLFGKPASLDMVEHEMLRKPGAYDDPRVHFAVNCASIGCPMLREEAYTAAKLEGQLEEQTRRFLGDRSRNRYASGRLEVSEIFKWFREDWERGALGYRTREQFFAKYADLLADDAAARRLVAEAKAPIAHLDYDWSLNDAR